MWGLNGAVRGYFGVTIVAVACCAACGGSNSEAKSPEESTADDSTTAAPASEPASKPPADDSAAKVPAEDPATKAPTTDTTAKSDDAAPKDSPKDNTEQKPEPNFTEGMSVNEAINAVPHGSEYLALDPETLGRPLADLDLYKPCKLNPSQHFKLRVAVWDGKAVGIDVTSANKKLAECVRQQVSQVQWHDKVKSINTVDYSY